MTLIYVAPTYGWWLLGLLGLSAVNLETLDWRMRRSPHPEWHAASSVLWTQVIVAAAAAFSGGPSSPALLLVAIPTVFAATRFPPRVALLATATAIGLLLLATFGCHPAASVAHPGAVIMAIAVLVGISAGVHALNGAEIQLRDTAILDPLTGLLNRHGLERRLEELAEQARLSGASIALLICDLDRFKAVNDSFGHAAGDEVLREIAAELRGNVRPFDVAYRLGGEEFLIVMPGATLAEARAVGERLCEATRRRKPRGIPLTLSVGVCAGQGADAGYATLFDAADRALYRAKAEGRDRVCSAPPRATDVAPTITGGRPRPASEEVEPATRAFGR